MKAMIFAAGLGSRLQPLTDKKPKALVEVAGKTLLLRAINYLQSYGIHEFVINTHHFSNQIIEYCMQLSNQLNIQISDESDHLLDTGGGLKKAGKWLKDIDEPLVVLNADILTNLNLDDMLKAHMQMNNLVTMAVRDRESSRKLVFNKDLMLVGWRNLATGEVKEIKTFEKFDHFYAFSGIHILSSELFSLFPEKDEFSIIDFYLEIVSTKNIGAFVHNHGYWYDVGTVEKLKKAEEYFGKKSI